MSRVAIVVQRCHESIVGGSEALAWQYANLLKDTYEVEVLTTTAIDTAEWLNTLPPGNETIEGVLVRRFPVTLGRLPHWGSLYERLLRDFAVPRHKDGDSRARVCRWSIPLQQEFVRAQGPYSAPLLQFLREQWRTYLTIIFVTYLYPTSYFGMLQVPRDFGMFAPTLHDEEPAYLSVYRHAARRNRRLIWLTKAEQRLGRRLWGELPGDVVGMKIDTELRTPTERRAPYLLYCGRIDPNKGCPELFEYFTAFKAENPSDLQLVLVGQNDIPVPAHVDIDYLGFVSAEEKFRLMAGAVALVMPSPRESFSIVTLEAMAQQTPVLGNEASDVVSDHLRQSNAGESYCDYPSFAQKLKILFSDRDRAKRLGMNGREYVLSNYKAERIRRDLLGAVENCSRGSASVTGDGHGEGDNQSGVETYNADSAAKPVTILG
jgi:glycosyltransferase involved in cell wall biosynthesis